MEEDGGWGTINPVGRKSGAVHCYSRRRPALYNLRLLRTGSDLRSLVIYGLLTSSGDVLERCRSGDQPEQTRDLMNLKLLFDGDGRQQDPTHADTNFLCSVPNSETLGSVPEYRLLARESWPF